MKILGRYTDHQIGCLIQGLQDIKAVREARLQLLLADVLDHHEVGKSKKYAGRYKKWKMDKRTMILDLLKPREEESVWKKLGRDIQDKRSTVWEKLRRSKRGV